MKPIQLTMTAFGPYKEKEIINFEQLHEHGIFVVSGSTGAGKTTIFDAITFALYDVGSGEDRDKANFLRSDFVDESVATEVELIFEVRGRRYRIWRKFGVDGAGAKREFYDITGGGNEPVVEKFQVRSIQAKVEELIGLTQSQFNQIVMLPQGEFQKLLTSESKHKEEIFRKIFKTERFTQMVDLLKVKKNKAEQAFKQAEMQQNQYILDIRGKLPERESRLFTVINGPAVNMYQLEQALVEEVQFYNEQTTEAKMAYDKLKAKILQQNQQLAAQQSLNERLVKFLARKSKLASLREQASYFDEQQALYELAQKANKIEPLERDFVKTISQLEKQQGLIEDATNQQQKAVAFLEEAQHMLEAEHNNEPEKQRLSKSITQLEQLEPVYKNITSLRETVMKLEDGANKAKKLFQQLVGQLDDKKAEQLKQEAWITQLEQQLKDYPQLLVQQQQLQQHIKAVSDTNDLQEQVAKLQKVAQEAKEVANQAQGQYEELEQQMRSNQATHLALMLEAGCACPVCGSTEHPAIHNDTVEQVDEQLVEQLRTKADKVMQNFYSAQSKFEAGQENLQNYQQQLATANLAVEELANYQQQVATLEAKLLEQNHQQQQLDSVKEELKELLQDIKQVQERIEKGRTYLSTSETDLAQARGQLEQSEKTMMPQFEDVQQLTVTLTEERLQLVTLIAAFEKAQQNVHQAELEKRTCQVNFENVQERLQELQKEQQTAKAAYEQALQQEGFTTLAAYTSAKLTMDEQEKLNDIIATYKTDVHTLSVQINEDAPQLEDKTIIDVSALEEVIQEMDEHMQQLFKKIASYESCEAQCEQTLASLKEVAKQIDYFKGKLTQVEHVYDLVRGQNEAKISFERFIQIGYLEKVTHAANERLRILSDGQYYLQCTGRKEGNAQSGLSIDVFDSNTGQTRDVKTLSGGEKFNASLSLALGMADVIQGVQGSVHIDTMFIDEGFGTLDEESLRKAIDILIDLQQTGRLIGVISHVAELKAAMPAILHVQKLKEGHSRTEILIK